MPFALAPSQLGTARRQASIVPSDSAAIETMPVRKSPIPSEPSRLDPAPDDYSRFIFQDKCQSTIYAGSGGAGCVSFLREKYIEEGPANGGDGGTGGNVYIQAVEGITSLHKLARRGVIRAGTGRNGRGKSQGGRRGEDVLIQVPVGTVVRELDRYDPVEEEEKRIMEDDTSPSDESEAEIPSIRHDRWVFYPGANPSDFLMTRFPKNLPRRPVAAAMEPKAPIYLDLSQHMDKPMLLAAGAVGGHGNPHFVSRATRRPKFASRGELGKRLELEFELKLLADVGLVGKPNAGKSTLLRSLTNSRTRIGNWEFTTLAPSIGTVIIDDHTGRPAVESKASTRRTKFTIADIPGLIEDAHLDRGLGLGFLRHVERAGILAFVVDLSAGDPVQGLQTLWNELGQYERLRDVEPAAGNQLNTVVDGLPELNSKRIRGTKKPQSHNATTVHSVIDTNMPDPLRLLPIHSKPWFVIATKADLQGTQKQYQKLAEYISQVEDGVVEHPGGHLDGWKKKLHVIPVSAKRGEGVSRIPRLTVGLLDDI